MMDSHIRSLVKGITWRITGSLDTFLISWLITGHASIAFSITLVELITKITLYWAHERVWLKVKWGVSEQPIDNQTKPSQPVDQTKP